MGLSKRLSETGRRAFSNPAVARVAEGGKRIVFNPAVMRLISDDRVMRAAESVMDART